MADSEHHNQTVPLLTDEDPEARSRPSSAQGSFEYVDYDSSESDESVTLLGSTSDEQVPPPVYDDSKHGSIKDVADAETLPEYNADTKSTTFQQQIENCLVKGDRQDRPACFDVDVPDKSRRRGCFARRCRCRAASTKSDKKRRVRRRFVIFIKAVLFFSFMSFFITKLCLRHARKEGTLPGFPGAPNLDKTFLDNARDSRKIIVNHRSQSIAGRYPLYDLLDLSTTSGDINVFVDPQPAHPDHPNEPARLVVNTKAGSVSVTFLQRSTNYIVTYANGDSELVDGFPTNLEEYKTAGATSFTLVDSQLPYRPYEIEIRTKSGSISGSFVFSASAYLESNSGQISAVLTPVVLSSSAAADAVIDAVTVVTQTRSGGQNIALHDPLVIDCEAVSAAVGTSSPYSSSAVAPLAIARHISKAGGISVEYPHSWAGNVTGLSLGGGVVLNGDNLQVTDRGRGYVTGVKDPEDGQSKWWGSRGDMDVLVESKGSGGIVFHVKDQPYDLSAVDA